MPVNLSQSLFIEFVGKKDFYEKMSNALLVPLRTAFKYRVCDLSKDKNRLFKEIVLSDIVRIASGIFAFTLGLPFTGVGILCCKVSLSYDEKSKHLDQLLKPVKEDSNSKQQASTLPQEVTINGKKASHLSLPLDIIEDVKKQKIVDLEKLIDCSVDHKLHEDDFKNIFEGNSNVKTVLLPSMSSDTLCTKNKDAIHSLLLFLPKFADSFTYLYTKVSSHAKWFSWRYLSMLYPGESVVAARMFMKNKTLFSEIVQSVKEGVDEYAEDLQDLHEQTMDNIAAVYNKMTLEELEDYFHLLCYSSNCSKPEEYEMPRLLEWVMKVLPPERSVLMAKKLLIEKNDWDLALQIIGCFKKGCDCLDSFWLDVLADNADLLEKASVEDLFKIFKCKQAQEKLISCLSLSQFRLLVKRIHENDSEAEFCDDIDTIQKLVNLCFSGPDDEEERLLRIQILLDVGGALGYFALLTTEECAALAEQLKEYDDFKETLDMLFADIQSKKGDSLTKQAIDNLAVIYEKMNQMELNRYLPILLQEEDADTLSTILARISHNKLVEFAKYRLEKKGSQAWPQIIMIIENLWGDSYGFVEAVLPYIKNIDPTDEAALLELFKCSYWHLFVTKMTKGQFCTLVGAIKGLTDDQTKLVSIKELCNVLVDNTVQSLEERVECMGALVAGYEDPSDGIDAHTFLRKVYKEEETIPFLVHLVLWQTINILHSNEITDEQKKEGMITTMELLRQSHEKHVAFGAGIAELCSPKDVPLILDCFSKIKGKQTITMKFIKELIVEPDEKLNEAAAIFFSEPEKFQEKVEPLQAMDQLVINKKDLLNLFQALDDKHMPDQDFLKACENILKGCPGLFSHDITKASLDAMLASAMNDEEG